jgi:plasmid maintenance system antidote protein VapI
MRQAHIDTMEEPGHIALERFMEANGHRDQWLADQIGSSQPTANRIRRGAARPSPDKAFKIEEITDGAVKASALLTGPLAAADAGAQGVAA